MEEIMSKIHEISQVRIESGVLTLTVDGTLLSRKLDEISVRLASASEEAQNRFEISPSGYGIHWPECDEDLSIDALLGVGHHSPMIAAEEGVEYRITSK